MGGHRMIVVVVGVDVLVVVDGYRLTVVELEGIDQPVAPVHPQRDHQPGDP